MEILLPAYAAHGDVGDLALVQALLDHVLIRRDAPHLELNPPLQLLRDLGARLAAHVELEEHELFPMIEQTLRGRSRRRRDATLGNAAGARFGPLPVLGNRLRHQNSTGDTAFWPGRAYSRQFLDLDLGACEVW